MRRHEALLTALIAVALVSAGLTWRFGFWGLVGPGVALLVFLAFAEVKGGDDA